MQMRQRVARVHLQQLVPSVAENLSDATASATVQRLRRNRDR